MQANVLGVREFMLPSGTHWYKYERLPKSFNLDLTSSVTRLRKASVHLNLRKNKIGKILETFNFFKIHPMQSISFLLEKAEMILKEHCRVCDLSEASSLEFSIIFNFQKFWRENFFSKNSIF